MESAGPRGTPPWGSTSVGQPKPSSASVGVDHHSARCGVLICTFELFYLILFECCVLRFLLDLVFSLFAHWCA
jgi:hypothetical protein